MSALRARHDHRLGCVLVNNRDRLSTRGADEPGDAVARGILSAIRFRSHQQAVVTDDGPPVRACAAGPIEQNQTAFQRVFNADQAGCPALRAMLGDLEHDGIGYQHSQRSHRRASEQSDFGATRLTGITDDVG